MLPHNFNPSFPSFKPDAEQSKQRPKIQIAPNTDIQDLSLNNVPNLGANLDLSGSIDFCAKNSYIQNSFYNQWQNDADDYEERKILEDLKGSYRPRNNGNLTEDDLFFVKERIPLEELPPERRPYNHNMMFYQTEQVEVDRPFPDRDELARHQKNLALQKNGTKPSFEKTTEASTKNTIPSHIQARYSDSPTLPKPERLTSNTNRSINKTVDSEFIQGPLPEKESPSKMGSYQEEYVQNTAVAGAGEIKNQKGGEVFKKYNKQHPERIAEAADDENFASESDLGKSGLQALKMKHQKDLQRLCNIKFNVMVIGESGLGKSTFIDAFLNQKYNTVPVITPSTEKIIERQGIRNFEHINFRINLIDTPGYHQGRSMESWYTEIKQYIIRQFDNYKNATKEARTKRKTEKPVVEDKRVHAILYFLRGPRISDEDVKYMKRLQKYGNIIPVIAKGDAYSKEEVNEVKRMFLEKTNRKGLELFNFESALGDDEEKLEELRKGNFGSCPPFVIISSIKKIEISPGKYIYGREYPWGLCNIENPQHSDFMLLRTLLGGHICHEAIHLTDICYKSYKSDQKRRQRKQKEEEAQLTKLGVGAAVTVMGIAGAYFAVKKKLLN